MPKRLKRMKILRFLKINLYKVTLLFNIFPSISPSVWFTSIYVQPRLFSLPFLVEVITNIKLNKWNLFLLINILVTIITPIVGLFFGRHFYLLDIAYFLSALYAFAFINLTLRNDENIKTFNKFVKMILIINIGYVFLQLIFYYSGFPQFTMIHSNIPFHVNDNYWISSGAFLGLPRYTGLFIENGPLTFFLCLSFLYLIQRGVNFPKYLKVLVFILIVFSQSKFLLLFIPVLLLESSAKVFFPRLYKLFVNPFFYLVLVSVIFLIFFMVIYNDYEIIKYFAKRIPAFQERLSGIRASLAAIGKVEIFGKGLLPTNFVVPGATYKLLGLDVFSVVFFGYGLFMGSIMILSYAVITVLAKIDYKFTFTAILFLGFLSSGSLLVPQYLFVLTYVIVGHYQNINYQKLNN
jgi:hypothetical protein